jgi:dihydroorotate dehydrogenase
MADMIPNTKSVEINLSCPNLPENTVPKLIDNDSPMMFTAFEKKRDWCIAKVSPFITGKELHHVVEKLNFRQIHLANTIPTNKGGLSGPALKQYVLQLIHYVRGMWGDHITIIAGGGIRTEDDITEYMDAGANHISLGTVCFNPFKLRKLLR